jgi:subtilisin family serine protease
MKNTLKLLSAICISAVAGIFTSCEDSGEDVVFESLEQQNELLVRYDYQAIPNQYVVNLKKGTLGSQPAAKGASSYKSVMENNKVRLLSLFGKSNMSTDHIKAVYGYAVEGFTAVLNEEQLGILGADARVTSIEQDYLITLGPPPGRGPGGGGGSGGGGISAQETPWGITRVNGGITYSGNNVAWILDSGIDLDHEDLNVDASRGFTAFTKGKDASLDDGDGHGTHVAGTVAALDNDRGVVGVAAGATVIPVKVLNSRGSGSYSGVIAGVDFVAANGSNGDVANMSLGGPVSTALDGAIKSAAGSGIRFSLAAGNESQDANNVSPARANGNNIYTISAMREGDSWASFSNFGNPPIDLCAPGVSIKSTWKDGGYNTISGTSMAAPHVAGILLLGNVRTDGTVSGDPDGNADPIAVH